MRPIVPVAIVLAALSFSGGDLLSQEREIVPVVGSTSGAFDSRFRTELQLTNPGQARISGFVVYRPAGLTGEAGTLTFPYVIGPHGTIHFDDIVAVFGAEGLGTLDVRPLAGTAPTVLARAFHDRESAGTFGDVIRSTPSDRAVGPGGTAILLAPADLERFRFNLGVRTLASGAVLRFTVFGSEGEQRSTTQQVWDRERFVQASATDLLETPLQANDSIHVEVSSGSAVVYGSTTDNATNDPSIQSGRPIDRAARRGTIPVVGSTAGVFDSLFRTELQLHNPSTETITGRLQLHRATPVGESMAPLTLGYVISARETIQFADVVALMGHDGLGSLDIVSDSGALPFAVARAFDDAPTGSKGVTVPLLLPEDAVSAGQATILVLPADLQNFRFNIGLRTIQPNTMFQMSLYDETGELVTELPIATIDAADLFRQQPASVLFGNQLPQNGSVLIRVLSGAAYFYATTTDNRSNDPSLQIEPVRSGAPAAALHSPRPGSSPSK